ncbi:unnamed protein product [Cuscuta epithymum]|uniref:Uncharacterized protein n=1 Tax=Cuscuta epithymum TaxID=186058 RepID=A0AAV0D295_9ASTE|nr:unnamed protein product [Cuscuta epithymum]
MRNVGWLLHLWNQTFQMTTYFNHHDHHHNPATVLLSLFFFLLIAMADHPRRILRSSSVEEAYKVIDKTTRREYSSLSFSPMAPPQGIPKAGTGVHNSNRNSNSNSKSKSVIVPSSSPFLGKNGCGSFCFNASAHEVPSGPNPISNR